MNALSTTEQQVFTEWCQLHRFPTPKRKGCHEAKTEEGSRSASTEVTEETPKKARKSED